MQLTQINGEKIELQIESEQAKAHFANPYNYTKEILAQFEQKIYNPFFKEKYPIILDIGSNVGLFALHVHPITDKLICVEPTPSHMSINEELNPNAWHCPYALSNHNGETTFYLCGINTTMNSLQDRGAGQIKVPCATLEKIFEEYNFDQIDLCKIDIEGSEWTAITPETLAPVKERIKEFFIELHPPDNNSQLHFKKIFEDAGYKVELVYHDSLHCTK